MRIAHPVDALGQAPLVAQLKSGFVRVATSETPANVQRLLREERLGLPTFVKLNPSASTTGLSKTRSRDPETAARSALKTLAPLYGLTSAEVDAAPLHHVQTMNGSAQLVRLTNQRDGIEVFREHATLLLNKQLQVTEIGGYLDSTTPSPAAATKAAAVARALQDFGFSDSEVLRSPLCSLFRHL